MRMRLALCLVALLAFGTRVSAREDRSLPKGWTPGPLTANLADRATIDVPAGYYYLDAAATKRLLSSKQQTSDGREFGTILRLGESGNWFAVFAHSDAGHIDDSEAAALDPVTLLTALQQTNQRVNAERATHGWAAKDLQTWHRPPSYSAATNRLTWSTRVGSGDAAVIHYDVRLLGRRGVMSARLVTTPDAVLLSTSQFVEVMLTYAFNDGARYSDFREGETVVEAGLTTLIVGDVAPVAAESGYFPGFWVATGFAIVAVALGAALFWRRREEQPALAEPPPPDADVEALMLQ
jgi:uncharacterized membrane-anchored protein